MKNKEQWFNKKEISAGKKRLMLTWWIYRHFGVLPIRIIAFFITLVSVFINKDIVKYSKKYFQHLHNYTKNKKYKPSFFNSLKHALNYSNALVDKMLAYSDNYKNIRFTDTKTEEEIIKLIEEKQGIFFITNHIGNINMMRSLIASTKVPDVKINIFLKENQCNIFNAFVNSISKQENTVQLYPVENINIETAIEIKEKIDNGEFVFMAGDRISAGSGDKNYQAKLLNKEIPLPTGVLKFGIMMDCPIYAITCAKENNAYIITTKNLTTSGTKEEQIETLKTEYPKILEKSTLKYPYQFYHFYDIFEN